MKIDGVEVAPLQLGRAVARFIADPDGGPKAKLGRLLLLAEESDDWDTFMGAREFIVAAMRYADPQS